MIQAEVSILLNNGINFYNWYQMAYLHTILISSILLLSCLHKFKSFLFKLFLKCIFAECYVKTSNVSSIDHKLQMHSLPLQHTSTIFLFLLFSLKFHTAFYPLLTQERQAVWERYPISGKSRSFMGMYGWEWELLRILPPLSWLETWLKPNRPIAKAEWTLLLHCMVGGLEFEVWLLYTRSHTTSHYLV